MNDDEWLDYAGYKHHTRTCRAVEYAGVSTPPHTYEPDEGIDPDFRRYGRGALRRKERRLDRSSSSTTASTTSLPSYSDAMFSCGTAPNICSVRRLTNEHSLFRWHVACPTSSTRPERGTGRSVTPRQMRWKRTMQNHEVVRRKLAIEQEIRNTN